MASVVISGDTSGAITISSPAVAGTNTLTLPAVTDTLTGIAATQTLTNKTLTSPTLTTPALGTPASGILTSCTGVNYDGFKNRIINSAMVIDQRNAGASVTINSAAWTYIVDRFCCLGQSADGVYTAQQSSTAPAGFANSLKITVTTADASVGATQIYTIRQTIEGYNIADLNWGTANAQSCTLSFWVQSSVTGTFSGCFNNEGTASYPFTYTINSANTWEQKTVTVAGPTSGTWGSTNSNGIRLTWSLGTGSTYSGTANTWNYSTEYFAASSTTNLISTNGATFYITGVQLEKGSTATSFDYRPYGTELALCQRYYQIIRSNAAYQFYTLVTYESATTAWGPIPLKVSMRSQPTTLVSGSFSVSYGVQGTYLNDTNQTGAEVAMIGWGGTGSGGTVGYAAYIRSNNSTASYMSFSAEL